MNIQYVNNSLTAEMLSSFRNTIGWGNTLLAKAEKAVQNTLFSIVAFDNDKAIGIGRLIGDGALIWYIQDVIVLPDYQRKSIGTAIMQQLLDYIRKNSFPNDSTTIGLMSAKGKEPFYQKFGFRMRPNEREGMGMVVDIKTI
ncbi:GCN5-related N-acetyltransferase [Ruminiclostridium papyrosolvens DSM 2782]|uniref:GCN5-related N-acetyltransferase n=1 Tax=Ruminiclostridium papyrosolvens DSM 2782 TaxID=588581 RepID=F1TFZ2_9FIRM|nr:GNAT family N-acetyltransferase [Ruminiclostridium papyrosolvens]EGD46611.1 GCN5-related N-acetyltransferase [Ruminiclostridium papyrosolvens DSM 2782]WES35761.1 GNAT family N-acetyltransferase [Ruminiclostridium papyrosolvens DSM 2782]